MRVTRSPPPVHWGMSEYFGEEEGNQKQRRRVGGGVPLGAVQCLGVRENEELGPAETQALNLMSPLPHTSPPLFPPASAQTPGGHSHSWEGWGLGCEYVAFTEPPPPSFPLASVFLSFSSSSLPSVLLSASLPILNLCPALNPGQKVPLVLLSCSSFFILPSHSGSFYPLFLSHYLQTFSVPPALKNHESSHIKA